MTEHHAPRPGERMDVRRPSRAALLLSAAGRAPRDPVVVILVLAGLFDGISGNAIHSILLVSAGLALAWEGAPLRRALTRRAGPGGLWSRSVERVRAGLDHGPTFLVVSGVLAYAVIAGGFGRFSWPGTLAVVVVGAAGIAAAWRGPLPGSRREDPIDPAGALAWAFMFLALALWELTNLLLQPSLTTDSRAHPTLSVLSDPFLGTHPGRTIGLVAWLGLGRFLVRR